MDNQSFPQEKKRHGCLTTWLIIIIIINSLVTLLYLFGQSFVKENSPEVPTWALFILAICGICNVVWAVLLFNWKKIGFWGFCTTSIGVFILNLSIGINLLNAGIGLIGILALFGVLQIGNENKGWTQLD